MSDPTRGSGSGARFNDAGHGYDVFGMHPPTVRKLLEVVRPVYERYFEVTSTGIENIPATGPVLVVPNHAGVVPLDGFLLAMNIDYDTERLARPVVDHFVPLVPMIGTLFSRLGSVGGSRGNLTHLLENGELVIVFPEGTSGPGKDPKDRYRLQQWRVGHAEFAIRHRVPIVPAAIIGSEEAWPLRYKIKSLRMFGAPYLPIPARLWPRKVPFHMLYGEPIDLYDGLSPDDADDPDIVSRAAKRTRVAVEELIERGLAERGGAR